MLFTQFHLFYYTNATIYMYMPLNITCVHYVVMILLIATDDYFCRQRWFLLSCSEHVLNLVWFRPQTDPKLKKCINYNLCSHQRNLCYPERKIYRMCYFSNSDDSCWVIHICAHFYRNAWTVLNELRCNVGFNQYQKIQLRSLRKLTNGYHSKIPRNLSYNSHSWNIFFEIYEYIIFFHILNTWILQCASLC